MKKFFITFAFAVIATVLFGMAKAAACIVPVDLDGGSPMAYDEQDLTMEFFKIDIRPTLNSSYSATIEFAVKNHSEADKAMTFGMPRYFQNPAAASSVTASHKNKLITVTLENIARNPQAEGLPYYNSMYTFAGVVPAGGVEYFRVSFTVHPRSDSKNMYFIDLPLRALGYWANETVNTKVVLDSFLLNIYSYDKMPDMMPSYAEATGALVWDMPQYSCDKNMLTYYNLDFPTLSRFFTNTYTTGEAKVVAELFSKRCYGQVIDAIDGNESLSENLNFQFMKMCCLESLGDMTGADEILSEIYKEDICFSTNSSFDISEYVKKRMLHRHYTSLKSKSAAAELLNEVLVEGMEHLTSSRSQIFINWMRSEMRINELSISQNYVPGVGGGNDGNGDEQIGGGHLTVKEWFKELSHPAVLTVGAVMVAVMVFCIVGMLADNNKKKRNERKQHFTRR